jgi:dipeptidyl aminopeptidase/acylaminoacyl peptidase
MNLAERKPIQLTDNGAANFGPYWLPDGKRIIFSSNMSDPKGRDFDLYLIDVATRAIERVTHYPGFDCFPMFSYDGRRLVFASNRNGKVRGETNVLIADGRRGAGRTNNRPFRQAAPVSGDGELIVSFGGLGSRAAGRGTRTRRRWLHSHRRGIQADNQGARPCAPLMRSKRTTEWSRPGNSVTSQPFDKWLSESRHGIGGARSRRSQSC